MKQEIGNSFLITLENKMDYDENYFGMSRTLGKSEDYKKYSFVKKDKKHIYS